jgi:hypothetical protein
MFTLITILIHTDWAYPPFTPHTYDTAYTYISLFDRVSVNICRCTPVRESHGGQQQCGLSLGTTLGPYSLSYGIPSFYHCLYVFLIIHCPRLPSFSAYITIMLSLHDHSCSPTLIEVSFSPPAIFLFSLYLFCFLFSFHWYRYYYRTVYDIVEWCRVVMVGWSSCGGVVAIHVV